MWLNLEAVTQFCLFPACALRHRSLVSRRFLSNFLICRGHSQIKKISDQKSDTDRPITVTSICNTTNTFGRRQGRFQQIVSSSRTVTHQLSASERRHNSFIVIRRQDSTSDHQHLNILDRHRVIISTSISMHLLVRRILSQVNRSFKTRIERKT